jgi:hypothetical protein
MFEVKELWSQEDSYEELADIKKEIEKIALRMQQKAKSRWVYEWPMRKAKAKWPVKELMARRQRRLLRGWLRYAENLNRPEEMVQMCEPETGRGLNDAEGEMRSARDLKHFRRAENKFHIARWARKQNWDRLKISRTARRAERKFQFSRWEMR